LSTIFSKQLGYLDPLSLVDKLHIARMQESMTFSGQAAIRIRLLHTISSSDDKTWQNPLEYFFRLNPSSLSIIACRASVCSLFYQNAIDILGYLL